MELQGKITEHFTLYEMTKSALAMRNAISNMPDKAEIAKLKDFSEAILEPVRDRFGSYRPNSVFRSPELNQKLGGSETSQHMLCEAADIEKHGVSNYRLARWIGDHLVFDQLILECYTFGVDNSGWVHVSRKPEALLNRLQVLTYSGGKYHNGLVQ